MTTTEHLRAAERFAAEGAGKGDERKDCLNSAVDAKTTFVQKWESVIKEILITGEET